MAQQQQSSQQQAHQAQQERIQQEARAVAATVVRERGTVDILDYVRSGGRLPQ
jgi:hypothetical protein